MFRNEKITFGPVKKIQVIFIQEIPWQQLDLEVFVHKKVVTFQLLQRDPEGPHCLESLKRPSLFLEIQIKIRKYYDTCYYRRFSLVTVVLLT